jgi:hypothetical protein
VLLVSCEGILYQGWRDQAGSPHLFLVFGIFPHDKLLVDHAAYEACFLPGTDVHFQFWKAVALKVASGEQDLVERF